MKKATLGDTGGLSGKLGDDLRLIQHMLDGDAMRLALNNPVHPFRLKVQALALEHFPMAKPEIDRLAEATGGRLHWNDPDMDDLEQGQEDFPLGTRVEVRTAGDIWRKGTIVETMEENGRAILVKCDEKWHDNVEDYGGHGAVVQVHHNTRRGILSNLRKIEEPRVVKS